MIQGVDSHPPWASELHFFIKLLPNSISDSAYFWTVIGVKFPLKMLKYVINQSWNTNFHSLDLLISPNIVILQLTVISGGQILKIFLGAACPQTQAPNKSMLGVICTLCRLGYETCTVLSSRCKFCCYGNAYDKFKKTKLEK